MEIEKFDIEGPLLIHGVRHHDERGYFSETFNQRAMREIGLPDFVQDNLSQSHRGVARGLHWQIDPMAQSKLVTCLSGAIVDIVVDIRKTSKTFGKHLEVELKDSSLSSFYVPRGFAHGFVSLEDRTLVSYKVDNFWSPSHEKSLNLESFLGNSVSQVILSAKDISAPDISGSARDSFFD